MAAIAQALNLTRSRQELRPVVDRSSSGRILQCFLGADLRNGHDGLAHLARKNKIDVANLRPGQYVIFINSAKNKLKLYAADNVVAYLKAPEGQKLDMATIQLIPRAFLSSGKIDYEKTLRQVLVDALERKRNN